MGTGIAEACAMTGLDVILVEVNEAVAETAMARVQHPLDRAVRGDKLGAEAAAQALARLRSQKASSPTSLRSAWSVMEPRR